MQHRLFEKLIENSDATGLHDEIRIAGGFEATQHSRLLVGIDNHLRPRRIFHVPMLLALVSIRLIKSHMMSAIGQGADNAPIVSGSPVPVSRYQTGSEKGYAHLATPCAVFERFGLF